MRQLNRHYKFSAKTQSSCLSKLLPQEYPVATILTARCTKAYLSFHQELQRNLLRDPETMTRRLWARRIDLAIAAAPMLRNTKAP